MMNSIWSDSIKIQDFHSLIGDTKTDVLIIGGGMAGILCAYFFEQADVDYILLEKNRIGGGITKNTTAKITSQHGLIYHKMLKSIGINKTKMHLDANNLALDEYRKICKYIECDFEEKDNYIYSLDNRSAIKSELSALKKLNANAEFVSTIPLPFAIAGSIKFPKQAQFNPLKFIAGISKKENIFEHTEVKELAPYTAITETGKITAKHIIVATHFPFLNKHGGYFLKLYQHRSYVIALENAPNIEGMYLEEKEDGLSFRNYKDYLIIGGGSHRTGKKGGDYEVLRKFAKEHYPNAIEKYAWATQDCMSLDGIPYIGKYGRHAEGLYVATGFNKWGMTGSMVSAMLLTDMILGKENPYAKVFSPQRCMLNPQLLLNSITAIGNLLTPTVPRCPHMGCALKWNKIENTWECPCHGSRFQKDGTLIDTPATGDLKI